MALLFLLNDVQNDLDEEHLISGDSETDASELGEKQSIEISEAIQKHITDVSFIAQSPASHILKLLHQIKIKSPGQRLTRVRCVTDGGLKERSFGVLNGSQHSLQSDLFTHSRICAENGETIAQCKDRIVNAIQTSSGWKTDRSGLFVSHPFACQIFTNHVLGLPQTLLCPFWFTKGALLSLERQQGKYNFVYKFHKAIHLLSNKEYQESDLKVAINVDNMAHITE